MRKPIVSFTLIVFCLQRIGFGFVGSQIRREIDVNTVHPTLDVCRRGELCGNLLTQGV